MYRCRKKNVVMQEEKCRDKGRKNVGVQEEN